MKDANRLEAAFGAAARRVVREFQRFVPLSLKRRMQRRTYARATPANRIFISGCARSGTTLTQRLMRCFEDIFVHPPEARYTILDMLDRPESNLVVKRDARSFAHLAKLPPSIGLIYCLRHPFDALTSSHPQTRNERRFHVTPHRWLAEYDALIQLKKAQPYRQIFFVRYEDMIGSPDAMQERIAQSFGLTPRIRFSEDPDNPIRAASLRKWERNEEFRTYLESLPPAFLARVERFCAEFGYDMPVSGSTMDAP
ncbi:sulfotransferase family protein [Mesorhizobium qingshengii]|uniref:Sulfotransferase family protein n=1 Tax=Mesorhizobium qingshengii TaxID=1165689 RepID=A0A1G5WA95_9HYPH|nr:sulfotransferase [Mesorhizobium qingshengii]SDA55010.1 Sulfotransferase family protein [Mesorhizobium qingshengii]